MSKVKVVKKMEIEDLARMMADGFTDLRGEMDKKFEQADRSFRTIFDDLRIIKDDIRDIKRQKLDLRLTRLEDFVGMPDK